MREKGVDWKYSKLWT